MPWAGKVRVSHVDDAGRVADEAHFHTGIGVGYQILAINGAAEFFAKPLLPGEGGSVDGDQCLPVH